MPDTAGLQPDTAGHTGHDRTHRTRPDTTGQYSRTLPDRDTRGAVQNEPDNTGHRTDKPDSIPDSIPDSSGQRTGQRTGHSPDTHRTRPDTPDNRTPTAQRGRCRIIELCSALTPCSAPRSVSIPSLSSLLSHPLSLLSHLSEAPRSSPLATHAPLVSCVRSVRLASSLLSHMSSKMFEKKVVPQLGRQPFQVFFSHLAPGKPHTRS